jgi:ABC-type transport system involved in multi-copper enzyme maturation permease subunit
MQFIAILKDSIREALDARIFWIIGVVGGILVLLGLTMRFEPLPKGKAVIGNLVNSLNPGSEGNGRGGPGRGRPMGNNLFGAFQGLFRQGDSKIVLLDAVPLSGGDLPTSEWKVTLEMDPQIAKSKGAKDSVAFLEGNFGKIANTPVVSVRNVKVVKTGVEGKPDTLEMEIVPEAGFSRLWPTKFSLFFGGLVIADCSERRATPFDALGQQILILESILVAGIGTWVALLLSVSLTSFFIPAMLRKGTIETLLVRPIARWRLLAYKYFGGLLFIGFGASAILGAVWLTISFQSGIWSQALLLMVPVIVFYYAFLHAVSTLGSVITRSAVFGLIAACLVWFSLFLLNVGRESIKAMDQVAEITAAIPNPEVTGPREPPVKISESTTGKVIFFFHRWLPRPAEIDSFVRTKLQEDLLLGREAERNPLSGGTTDWKESALVTLVHTILAMAIACLVFTLRDP